MLHINKYISTCRIANIYHLLSAMICPMFVTYTNVFKVHNNPMK